MAKNQYYSITTQILRKPAKIFWVKIKALRAFDSLEDCPTFIRNLVQAWLGYASDSRMDTERNGITRNIFNVKC